MSALLTSVLEYAPSPELPVKAQLASVQSKAPPPATEAELPDRVQLVSVDSSAPPP